MPYREFAPPPLLRRSVECGWSATPDGGGAPQVQRVLPDGCMDLIWSGSEVLIAGPDTAAHAVVRDPGGPVVGLRFAPGALAGLLGVPAAELRDRRVPLAELHPRLGGVAPPGPDRPPAAVLVEVALALPGRTEPVARDLAVWIGGGAGAAVTADALGCTTRTLHRRCLELFGYGPAVLRRVLRFRRAAELLYAGVAPAEVAAVAGYADQPHLSREVRALAGVAPGRLAPGSGG